jgi:glycosyltransferase involved in cell wall biosynthesis
LDNRQVLEHFSAKLVPSENEIKKLWVPGNNEPIVSILCHVYNQRQYVEDAIKGFLIQKTNFPFEIILHDDASTDGTTGVVQEYAERYPDIIKPIIQSENKYSKGVKPSTLSFPHARGNYIAMCEGDDYWVSETKLQAQFDCLENNSEISLSFHRVISVKGSSILSDKKYSRFLPNSEHVVPVSLVILMGGGYIPTPSIFARRSVFDNLPGWFHDNVVGDYNIQVIGSFPNGAIYIDEPLSVYRVGSDGSWTNTQKINIQKKIEYLTMLIAAYENLSIHCRNKYNNIFSIMIKRVGLEIELLSLDSSKIKYKLVPRVCIKAKILFLKVKKVLLAKSEILRKIS